MALEQEGNLLRVVENSDLIQICSSLSIFFLVAFANAHNDIIDIETDKINRPARPVPSGKITVQTARKFTVAALVFALAFGFASNVEIGILITATAFMSYIYNKYLKGLPLVGNFCVALLTTVPIIIPIIANYPHTAPISYYTPLLHLAFCAFMLTFCREIIKDIEDIAGDRKLNLKTFPILTSPTHALVLTFICELQLLLQLALFNLKIFAAVAPILIISSVLAIVRKFRLSQQLLKLAMAVGLIAFVLW
ncbi:geranylgeranylglycerol-phosphate geranylgeranyltransferase [Fibrobacterales bacterium]|nr:geranylgeranylglycerol-phosphate geranylgeranyltransferase [Fibrobacterales bacterium]